MKTREMGGKEERRSYKGSGKMLWIRISTHQHHLIGCCFGCGFPC